MIFKMLKNESRRNKCSTGIMILFVAAAALFVSLTIMLTVYLSGAIDALMQKVETPHFMQMHTGQLDQEAVKDFAQHNSMVSEWQISEFLNIENADIILGTHSLSGSAQDHGLSVQGENFDYLLDLNGEIIYAAEGELYVPIGYMQDESTQIGDTAYVCGKKFRVAGFLRDSQMNASLASSKRFLVSAGDYSDLKSSGTMEYLIEFRLNEMTDLGAFEAAYRAAGLPANGPVITYPLFKMIHALSDGILIGVLLLISFLVMMMALLCIRLSLLTGIEEDYREIGVMKAVGLRLSDMRLMYLTKYAVTGGIGCLLGYVGAYACRDILLRNIRLMMGESEHVSAVNLLAAAGVVLIWSILLLFVNGVLRCFKHISAAEAIRFGVNRGKRSGIGKFSLSRNTWMNIHIFLGIKDVLIRKRLYATLFLVLVLAAFMMIVPQRLYHTLSDESFASYMGIGSCDIRIDIQQTDRIEEKAAGIAAAMERDSTVAGYTILTTKIFSMQTADGGMGNLQIESGDHMVFPIACSKGRLPVLADDIALSELNAEELQLAIGDEITVYASDGPRILTVCGIYSDITNGGKTAKAVFTDPSADTMWCVINVSAQERNHIADIVRVYAADFPFAKVTGTREYMMQTYGQTLYAMKSVAVASAAAAAAVTMLVTLLFMKMLTAKDRYEIAVMKACGLTDTDIGGQYAARMAFVLIMGMIGGILLAGTAGERIAGIVLTSLGVSSFRFAALGFSVYLLCALCLTGAVLIAVLPGAADVKRIRIAENMKE